MRISADPLRNGLPKFVHHPRAMFKYPDRVLGTFARRRSCFFVFQHFWGGFSTGANRVLAAVIPAARCRARPAIHSGSRRASAISRPLTPSAGAVHPAQESYTLAPIGALPAASSRRRMMLPSNASPNPGRRTFLGTCPKRTIGRRRPPKPNTYRICRETARSLASPALMK